jgi:hypothetical protein
MHSGALRSTHRFTLKYNTASVHIQRQHLQLFTFLENIRHSAQVHRLKKNSNVTLQTEAQVHRCS